MGGYPVGKGGPTEKSYEEVNNWICHGVELVRAFLFCEIGTTKTRRMRL